MSAHLPLTLRALQSADTKEVDKAFRLQSGLINYDQYNVKPLGSTYPYASPEQLRALQLLLEGEADCDEAWINGPSADNWAVGAVLFEMLTGRMAFRPDANAKVPEPPECVLPKDRKRWQEYESYLQLHRDWVRSSSCAYEMGFMPCN